MARCSSCTTDADERPQWFGPRTQMVRLVVVFGLVGCSWGLHWLHVGPDWLAAMLAVGAAAIGVWPLALNAVENLFQARIRVDTLVTIAVVASVAVEEYRAAGMVTFIMLLGEFLERRAADRAKRAIRQLLDLAPKTAVVKRDGREVEVDAKEVTVGDVLVVRPGEQIAADGLVVSGQATVDEAAITGESVP
ncbi:MAG: HAD-IC family P-type ATPase, partial [Armatimonadota bacterium]